MFEAIFVVVALVGALSLAFAIMTVIADYVLPAIEDRPQATRRRK